MAERADEKLRDRINELFRKLDERGTHPDSRVEWTIEGWELVFDER